ncbi:hypothetical protein [Mesorhizobium sp. BR1-1-12]|uniref:hypothetical protein n=1 Tax=Mesorhizobium sp. BR1-1-12 TaxID=2876657 RepID=UPI00398CE60D
MTAAEIQSIEERFPQVFRRPFHKRFGPLLLLGGILLYLLYALGSSICRKCCGNRIGSGCRCS